VVNEIVYRARFEVVAHQDDPVGLAELEQVTRL